MLSTCVFFSSDDAPNSPAALFVEVPVSTHEMQQGLAGRLELADGCGMLFDMGDEALHCFHMIGVAFPLDFIFVTSDGRVGAVLPNQRPGLPEVTGIARWVVEAPAGWAARNGVRAGSIISFV
jgi:uncharacterized membrane protein (UPF0127 family)